MENSYVIDGRDIDKKRIVEAVMDVDNFIPRKKEEKWLHLIKRIPLELRSLLLSELTSDNSVESIQNSNWPQQGSVVVALNQHLKSDASKISSLLKYRILNDPHYWYDEVSQIQDNIEYMIIT